MKYSKWMGLALLLIVITGCASGAHPLVAQGSNWSLTFIPPLTTLTPRVAPPTITLSACASWFLPHRRPTPGVSDATVKPDPTPEITLGQKAYTLRCK